jgi:hypothetical protein
VCVCLAAVRPARLLTLTDPLKILCRLISVLRGLGGTPHVRSRAAEEDQLGMTEEKKMPAAAAAPQLTPTAGRLKLQKMRPSISAFQDLARARGKAAAGTNVPDQMPGNPPLFVGSGAHAADLKVIEKLGITAVLNCAPSVCKDPVTVYKHRGIAYAAVDAQDDRNFPLLERCLPKATAFIAEMHAEGRSVLVHCMAGVNRSATLAVAYLLVSDKQNVFELFAACSAARPSILQNPSFQLQLCTLAHRHGLLSEPAPTIDIVQHAAAGAAAGAASGAASGAATGARVVEARASASAAPAAEPTCAARACAPAAAERARGLTAGTLTAHALTGNRQMAEDLDRQDCATCGRTFAPSVLVRHAPICAKNAAQAAARKQIIGPGVHVRPSSAEPPRWDAPAASDGVVAAPSQPLRVGVDTSDLC